MTEYVTKDFLDFIRCCFVTGMGHGCRRVVMGIVYGILIFVLGMLCGVVLGCIVQIDRVNKEKRNESANSNVQK